MKSRVTIITTVLVVLALLASMHALSVVGRGSDEAINQRNAQQLASVFGAAKAAGLDFGVITEEEKGSPPDVFDIIDMISRGKTIEEGSFAGTYFGVTGLSEKEQKQASLHLAWSLGNLNYQASAITRPGVFPPPKRHSIYFRDLAPLVVVLLSFWGYVIWEIRRRNRKRNS